MLPAVASRYNPALNIMKSITDWQGQQLANQPRHGQQPSAAVSFLPAQMSARANEAINDIFSVNYVTPTELMIRIVEKAAGYLNGQLSDNADQTGDPATVATAKREWRDNALNSESRRPAADGRLKIPKVGENGVTFRQVAQRILDTFDNDYLSGDLQLKKELEDMIGFRLDGISAVDLLQAAADPASKVAKKVDEALTEGLAGQKGSKVSQRLERAAQGPQSVGEAVADALNKSPLDAVDAETIADDRKAIANAAAHDKLEKVLSQQQEAAKANKDEGAEQVAHRSNENRSERKASNLDRVEHGLGEKPIFKPYLEALA